MQIGTRTLGWSCKGGFDSLTNYFDALYYLLSAFQEVLG